MSKEKYGLDHFEDEEFACKCGCGLNQMNLGFVQELNLAREWSGVQMVVNSGHRCVVHNASDEVRGSSTSSHLKGLATDVQCEDMANRADLIYNLLAVGILRIGVYPTFLHIDNDKTKPRGIFPGE